MSVQVEFTAKAKAKAKVQVKVGARLTYQPPAYCRARYRFHRAPSVSTPHAYYLSRCTISHHNP